MDSRNYLLTSPETMSSTASKTQWKQQIFIPVLKQEIENENSPDSDYNMYPSETLKLSNHVNYYDNKLNMFEQVKEESSGSEHPQANCGMNTKVGSENNELVYFIDKQNVKNENPEKVSRIKQENDETMYQIITKLETPDEIEMSDSAEDTSTHYDVLVTPQEVQCKLCRRVFMNSFNLLKHNIEHIKIKINTLGDNLIEELQRSQYCDDILAHVSNVHGKGNFKSDVNIYVKNKHISNNHMKLCHHPNKINGEINYKRDTCGIQYKSEQSLINHTKMTHFDYEIKIESDCGNELLKPIQLPSHDRISDSTYNDKIQCDHCQRSFKQRSNLRRHVRRNHYDYGRVFKCWCGKEFRSPYQLYEHKAVHNYTNGKIQCETCKKFLRTGIALVKHRRYIHNDYGKLYECWCGKEFPTPSQLAEHTNRQHNSKIDDKNNDKVQCDDCKKYFKTKNALSRHVMRVHYDYGEKVFRCPCEKVFRTPYHLADHKLICVDVKINRTLINNFQCDVCQKHFKNKRYLGKHRNRMHKSHNVVF